MINPEKRVLCIEMKHEFHSLIYIVLLPLHSFLTVKRVKNDEVESRAKFKSCYMNCNIKSVESSVLSIVHFIL